MRQRLGLAFAMIGDPGVLILDEPANGLDPEGITWLRRFLRHLATQGRTVLVSSHLLSEVEQTVDRVVILSRGQLVKQGTITELSAGVGESVFVRSPQVEVLAKVLADNAQVVNVEPGTVRVSGLDAAAVGHHAFTAGVELHELRTERSDLEQIFFQLTGGAGEAGAQPGSPPAAAGDTAPASTYGQQGGNG
jgi:ABC-2 type transport system ATP-binding protein